MSLALCAMSHSPLLGHADPEPELAAELDAAFATARSFVEDFDPELVVVFGPDHYNGFFYDLMPPFAIGLAGAGVGDYGTSSEALTVPEDIAGGCVRAVLDADVDVAVSLRMELDHGAIQPLELLFGDITAVPTIPVFVNSVAAPFTPPRRVRALGEALGRHLARLDARVLLLGSGGLSHDPPVPRLATVDSAGRERLIDGRHLTDDARTAREQRVIDAARAFAAGQSDIRDLNPSWDNAFLDILESGRLNKIDGWTNEWVSAEGGNSAHEVRTWIAAYSALAAGGGPYELRSRYYRPIPEFIAGFAVTTATPSA